MSILIAKLELDSGIGEIGINMGTRCIERAVAQINHDLKTSFEVSGDDDDAEVLPEPTTHYRELILILAHMHLVGMGRMAASEAVSWKSGPEEVDRARTALSKTELTRDLWKQYLSLAGIAPDALPLVSGTVTESTGGDIDWSANRDWVR